MLIGITGQIGSGKSEVARIFGELGAFVISADQIGKEVVEQSKVVLNKLVKAFGKDILTPSGKLRRRKLGEIAFSSESNKKRLNDIVHLALLKEQDRQSKLALKKYRVVVIDAALLIDWGWQKKVDLTILVNAGKDIKIKRLIKRGLTKSEAEMRLNSQLKYTYLRKHSNIVILNNKTIETLALKIEKIFKSLPEKG
ncbi:MAG: dephospho-CoA kinase [Candidatus Zixiibacteriota bacterium]